MRPTWRAIPLAVIGATIAVTGFYVGYARAGQAGTEQELPQPDLRKVPRWLTLLIALEHAGQLNLSPNQLQALRTLEKKMLPRYIAAQKDAWNDEVRIRQQQEEGLILEVWRDMPEELFDESRRRLYSEQSQMWSAVNAILTKKQLDSVHKIYTRLFDGERAASFDFLMSPQAEAALGFSKRQRNQFQLLRALYARLVEKKVPPLVVSHETMGPLDDQRNFDKARAGDPIQKGFWLHDVREQLSPLQKLKLKAILHDKFYVLRQPSP